MGHAIVGNYLEFADPVHKISVIQRGRALGYTISMPTEDRFLTTRQELLDTMAMTLGGRAAEEVVFGEITTGASNDLEKVTATAKQMVMRFGMSDKLGPRVYGHDHGQPFLGREFSTEPDYSDQIAREIDDEVRRIIEGAHERARAILDEHRERLDTISQILRAPRDDREGAVREAARRASPRRTSSGPTSRRRPSCRPAACRRCPSARARGAASAAASRPRRRDARRRRPRPSRPELRARAGGRMRPPVDRRMRRSRDRRAPSASDGTHCVHPPSAGNAPRPRGGACTDPRIG